MQRSTAWFTFLCSIVVLFSPALASTVSTQQAPTITITTPHTGETVTPTFDLTYAIVGAPHGSHAHVYLDGSYQKGFKGTFTDVPKGDHEITVKIAGHDHKDQGTSSDTVTVTVTQ